MNKSNQVPWCCWLPSYCLSVPLPSIHICFMIPGHDLPISPLLSGSARAEEQRACVLCSQSLTPSSWYQSPLLLLLMFWHCQNQLIVSSCKTSTSQQAHTHKHTPPPLSRTGPFLWASRFWYPQPLLVPLASGCTSSGRYFFLHYLSVPFAL